jgi:VanZ family protein
MPIKRLSKPDQSGLLDWITRKYWPGSLWALIILLLTGLPGNYFPKVMSFWDWLSPDKLVHLFIFGVFTFLLLWGYRAQYLQQAKRFALVRRVFGIGLFYSVFTELMQAFVFVGRDGNIFDLLANIIGSLLGIGLFVLMTRKNKRGNNSFT